jgi:ribonuclease BN (tRNA processing enzyme)
MSTSQPAPGPHATPLDLLFIGSGNAFADARCWSGFLLNDRYLFDAPPSALYGLKRGGADLDALDVILLSHFHGDHFFGLPFLLLEYAYPGSAGVRVTSRRTRDLTIIGPPGVADKVEALTELAYPSLVQRDLGFRRRYIELEPGRDVETDGLRVSCERMNHALDTFPLCLGYRVECGGRRIAYTGDTGWTDALLDLGRGTEVFVTDCNYPRGFNQPEHLSLDEVAVLRHKLDERTAIILTHLGHDRAPVDIPCTYRAEDLMRFHLP